MSSPEFPDSIANYWLLEELGSGYSGSIFRAQHIYTKQIVALKLQDINHECPTNRYERGFYPHLQGGKGMPILHASGQEGAWDYLAIELLGPSLHQLFRKLGRELLDLRSVCCIAQQVIERLECMHNRGILHRDIQLGNCTVGLHPNDKMIYMIDFGFSKRYIDPLTRKHIPDSNVKRDFIGNYWFSSIGVHCRGKVPSRRDDLEAAALMFIHLLTPNGLPWTRNGVPRNERDHDFLKNMKRSKTPEDLCQGLPTEFEEFLRYCRRLKFAQKPDYSGWIRQFRELAVDSGFTAKSELIWPPPSETARAPRRSQVPPGPASMEKMLQDLANLNLGAQVPRVNVLGDRQKIDDAVKRAKSAAKEPESNQVIVISSESEGDYVPARKTRASKAHKLDKLSEKALFSTDNITLADVVLEYSATLKSYSSRALTKEGFSFLDALHKQLADPSVFHVSPSKPSKPRSSIASQEPAPAKLDVVARLRHDVALAKNNTKLADMVDEFLDVTRRSSGRTVTKDGFAFLEGLAARLKDLR